MSEKRELPSSVFLKLKLAALSMESDSYWVRLRQNSTSAEEGSLGVLALSWFPGFRSSGPSGVPSHKACRLLYSSRRVQMIYTKTFMLKELWGPQHQKGEGGKIHQELHILKEIVEGPSLLRVAK